MKSSVKRPFYSSGTIIVLFPLLIFVLFNVMWIAFGMETIDAKRIDKVFHIVGAISIYCSVAGILWHLMRRKLVDVQDVNVFRMLVFGFVCFTIISWEIFEYIVSFKPEYLTYSDTVTDMICGLIGGLFAMVVIRNPVG